MTTLQFEHGAKDLAQVKVSADWFQITYDEIRDVDDICIAYRDADGFWLHNGVQYSDIVIY